MSNQTVNTTIEILGKPYPIRCQETEVESLKQAASYLDDKMREIHDSGRAINIERIAIMAALNVAHEFLQLNQQKEGAMDKINQRIAQLQNKLDAVIYPKQTELVYSIE